MRLSGEFRSIARDALRGRWGDAVIASLVAGFLGATTGGFNFDINVKINSNGSPNVALPLSRAFQEIGNNSVFATVLLIFLIVLLVFFVAFFIIGSIVNIGHAKYYLDLVDMQQDVRINLLFKYIPKWKTAIAANFLQAVYVLVGTLLFVVPGIIAVFNYSMTSYILADNPEMPAREAMRLSKEMMKGNRFRLFCLEFSFIGWSLLSLFTCGIGLLWVTAYQNAAVAAFYREISGTEIVAEQPQTQQ